MYYFCLLRFTLCQLFFLNNHSVPVHLFLSGPLDQIYSLDVYQCTCRNCNFELIFTFDLLLSSKLSLLNGSFLKGVTFQLVSIAHKIILIMMGKPGPTYHRTEAFPERVFRLSPGNTGLPRVGFFVSLTATCVTRCYPVAIETRLLCYPH